MKILFFVFILFLIFGCTGQVQTPDQEKQTIIEKLTGTGVTKFVNTQIYPVLPENQFSIHKSIATGDPSDIEIAGSTGPNGYIDLQPQAVQNDLEQANFYYNNSFSNDGEIHILDIGNITNNNQAFVAIDCIWVSGGANANTAQIAIRAAGSNYQWQNASINKNGLTTQIKELTSLDGKFEWKQLTTNPYDAITKDANPGVHDYQYATIQLKAVWLVTGVVIQ